jgi:hypothetical protein
MGLGIKGHEIYPEMIQGKHPHAHTHASKNRNAKMIKKVGKMLTVGPSE